MSCGSGRRFAAPVGDVENSSVSELVTSLRSAFSAEAFEEVNKHLEAIQRKFDREVEHLRSENKSFRIEFERVNLENIRLEDELRKCRTSSDECVVAERPGIAEDVYDILMEKVRRGGGETSLKEIFNELRRKNKELEGEKRELEGRVRVWAKKYKELDERVLQLERDASTWKNEEQCILGKREGVREPDGLINVNACGDYGSTRRGSANDSQHRRSVSLAHNARKQLDFGTDGVLRSDGSSPIVEIIDSDDNCGGPSEKLSGNKYCGRRNDEKGNKELKRKRGSDSSVFDKPFTQTLRDVGAALQRCEQKNIKEKDSDNSLSKSRGVNPIEHKNGAGSASAKSDDGSSLHKKCWKYEADMLCDISKDDELCLKAVCALYRQQRSKSMERSSCQGFDGLLSPRETSLAEFLTGGDPEGKLKKSVMDLRDHLPGGLSDCRRIAIERFKQLFIMYRSKEDPLFPSS